MAESELEKSTSTIAELTRRVDELQEQADEASKLKDQLDEYDLPYVPTITTR
jgi:protein HOOK3